MERGDLLERERRDLQAPGPGHRRPRRLRRAGARGREPVQHQLPDRPVQRPRGPRRPLVRHDPPRPEPGQEPAGQAGPGCRCPRSPTWPSGATTRPPSSPTSPTPASAASPSPRSSPTPAWLQGEFLTTVQKRGAAIIEARGALVGRLGGQRGHRHGGRPAHPDPRRRLRLGGRGQLGPVRDARGAAVRLPGPRRRPRAAGRWSRASSTTTSPPSGSGSRPRSCWPSGPRWRPSGSSLGVNPPAAAAARRRAGRSLDAGVGQDRSTLRARTSCQTASSRSKWSRSPSSHACSSSSNAASSASSSSRYFRRKWSSSTWDTSDLPSPARSSRTDTPETTGPARDLPGPRWPGRSPAGVGVPRRPDPARAPSPAPAQPVDATCGRQDGEAVLARGTGHFTEALP